MTIICIVFFFYIKGKTKCLSSGLWLPVPLNCQLTSWSWFDQHQLLFSWTIPWCGLGDAAAQEFFSTVVGLLIGEGTRGQVVLSHLPSGLRNWASHGLFTNMFGIYFSFDPCWVLKLESDPSGDCVGGGQWGDDGNEHLTLLFVYSLEKRAQMLLKRPRSFQGVWRKLKSSLEGWTAGQQRWDVCLARSVTRGLWNLRWRSICRWKCCLE